MVNEIRDGNGRIVGWGILGNIGPGEKRWDSKSCVRVNFDVQGVRELCCLAEGNIPGIPRKNR
jgi:hypothetical protein